MVVAILVSAKVILKLRFLSAKQTEELTLKKVTGCTCTAPMNRYFPVMGAVKIPKISLKDPVLYLPAPPWNKGAMVV